MSLSRAMSITATVLGIMAWTGCASAPPVVAQIPPPSPPPAPPPAPVENMALLRAESLSRDGDAAYAMGSRASAAINWRSAGIEYARADRLLLSAEAMTKSAQAFRETQQPLEGMAVLESALSVIRWSGDTGIALDQLETELAATEALLADAPQVTARINSDPPGMPVRYRRYLEKQAPLLDIQTNTQRTLDPAMYLFILTRADGTKVERSVDCSVPCTVSF